MINIAVAILFLISLMFTKLYLFYISTRVAKVRTQTNVKEKGYRKYYLDYMFLSKETHPNSQYSLHHMALNLLKDPIISIFLVFSSKNPFIQTGSVLVIMFTYFFLEIKDRPNKEMKENVRNIISLGVYTIAITLFLILAFQKNNISESTREKLIGIPLIILFSILIVSNYIISTYDTIIRCRNRCKAKPEDSNKVSDSAVVEESAITKNKNLEGLSGIKLKRRVKIGEENQAQAKKIKSKIEDEVNGEKIDTNKSKIASENANKFSGPKVVISKNKVFKKSHDVKENAEKRNVPQNGEPNSRPKNQEDPKNAQKDKKIKTTKNVTENSNLGLKE